MNTTDTRPFDRAAVQTGAPYACANGERAAIWTWDAHDTRYHLVGTRGADEPSSWTGAGRHCSGLDLVGEYSEFDLVMTPLGYLDGKPVFDGDLLVDTRGARRLAHAGLTIPGSWKWPALRPAPAPAEPPAAAAEDGRAARDLDVAETVVRELRRLLDNQPSAVWELLNRQHLTTIIARVPS